MKMRGRCVSNKQGMWKQKKVHMSKKCRRKWLRCCFLKGDTILISKRECWKVSLVMKRGERWRWGWVGGKVCWVSFLGTRFLSPFPSLLLLFLPSLFIAHYSSLFSCCTALNNLPLHLPLSSYPSPTLLPHSILTDIYLVVQSATDTKKQRYHAHLLISCHAQIWHLSLLSLSLSPSLPVSLLIPC